MNRAYPIEPDDFKRGQYLIVQRSNLPYAEAVSQIGEKINIPPPDLTGLIVKVLSVAYPYISVEVILYNNKIPKEPHGRVMDTRQFKFMRLRPSFVDSLHFRLEDDNGTPPDSSGQIFVGTMPSGGGE